MENNRPQNSGYPGSEWTPSIDFDVSQHIRRLTTSPNAVQVVWLRAFPDPTYNPENTEADEKDKGKEFIRVKQPGTFWVILAGANMLRRFYQSGTWESGDVTVSFYYPYLPLSEWDIIIPLGNGEAPPGAIDFRTFTQKQTINRASKTVPGVGSVTMTGVSVVGTGTNFTTYFNPGDIMFVGTDSRMVQSVTDDTHLTLTAAFGNNFSGIVFNKGVDRLLYPPVARIQVIRNLAGAVLVNGTDYVLGSDQETIQWLTPNAPQQGEGYGVIYDYAAQYELTNLGMKRQVVNGIPMLDMQVAHLWKPETTAE
jgi:hypothetical protein